MPAPDPEAAPGTHPGRHRGGQPSWLLLLVVVVIAALLGGAGLVLRAHHPSPARAAAALAGSPATTGSVSTPSVQAPYPAIARPGAPGIPVSVQVPSVGISSTLENLGLLPDRSLQPPTDFGRAGWYAGGVRPGAVGPALIAGHVDSVDGPAIFYRLSQVRLGADVDVKDQAGVVRHFRVTTIATYPKNQFPSEAVYGPTPLPIVRLVTCTGDFDASKRSYVDNLVVSATLDATRAG